MYSVRVSSRIFQLGGPASLASQILYLITTVGKSLTRPFPGVAIKQRVWSARLGEQQRDLSVHPTYTIGKGRFWIPAGVGGSRKFGGLGPD